MDINKIGLIEQDTEHLQKILKPIFADENKEVEDESNTPKPFVSDIQGLNNEHAGLFHFLIAKKDWSKEEIDEQCKKLGLMVDGALETLNEFALDKTGEQLIEEYDGVFSIELETTKELLK